MATYSKATILTETFNGAVNGSPSTGVLSLFKAASNAFIKVSGIIYMHSNLTSTGSAIGGAQWAGAVATPGNSTSGITYLTPFNVTGQIQLGTLALTSPTDPQLAQIGLVATSTNTSGNATTIIILKDFLVPSSYYFELQNGITYNNTATYTITYNLTAITYSNQ